MRATYIYGTGWHAAARGGVTKGSTVTVIGDGAVRLRAVLSAHQLGAEQIVLMGRHQVRTDLGQDKQAIGIDRTVGLEQTPQAYTAMDDREALKVMVRP